MAWHAAAGSVVPGHVRDAGECGHSPASGSARLVASSWLLVFSGASGARVIAPGAVRPGSPAQPGMRGQTRCPRAGRGRRPCRPRASRCRGPEPGRPAGTLPNRGRRCLAGGMRILVTGDGHGGYVRGEGRSSASRSDWDSRVRAAMVSRTSATEDACLVPGPSAGTSGAARMSKLQG